MSTITHQKGLQTTKAIIFLFDEKLKKVNDLAALDRPTALCTFGIVSRISNISIRLINYNRFILSDF